LFGKSFFVCEYFGKKANIIFYVLIALAVAPFILSIGSMLTNKGEQTATAPTLFIHPDNPGQDVTISPQK
jgi:hypothetical protein